MKNRLVNRIISAFLIVLAVVCVVGIIYEGRSLRTQNGNMFGTKEKQLASAVNTESEQGEAQDENTTGQETETSDGNAAEQTDASAEEAASASVEEQEQPATVQVGDVTFHGGYTATANESTIVPSDTDVLSSNSVLIDLSTDTVVAAKDADVRIYPASMTKIMTILVAAEHIDNLDDTFTMTPDIISYSLSNGCSAAGFVEGETIPVRDLFYGTILPSGGEAAVGLATYVAGSQEDFVELMNQKLQELGLSETAHFTNCVGLYDDDHYCTTMDMAMILKAAVQNDWCREVLSAHVYNTTVTEQNPEGIVLSNWFLRRIEDKDCGGEVLCAKTGYVTQSGDCAASYEISASGKPYICVTANTYNSWRCIYDHVAMYKLYAA
jgi:D-alanyl-D-alanine carboxypeptidase (penicillin-binding protein 5/6)